jgi:formate-dependent nitrite reductase membrane component NrfD
VIDLGVNAAEVVPLLCLLMAVFAGIGANALTLVVVDRVVAATNPSADQMANLVTFIVCLPFFSLQG